jgi:hypothetical protein
MIGDSLLGHPFIDGLLLGMTVVISTKLIDVHPSR